ncbi:hypothetical protein AAHA92_12687 [Salvia divinorum]|uniref:Uncharacterized protein n=1 Tax=Salvia divinorum TaxID=28513 RepID=A0ABD1HMB0_SALDI
MKLIFIHHYSDTRGRIEGECLLAELPGSCRIWFEKIRVLEHCLGSWSFPEDRILAFRGTHLCSIIN